MSWGQSAFLACLLGGYPDGSEFLGWFRTVGISTGRSWQTVPPDLILALRSAFD